MKKLNFTIVELLVAMGLMMMVVNLLSQVYTRVSEQSLHIVSTKKTASDAMMILNKLQKDLAFARIDNTGAAASRNFRMMLSYARQNKSKSGTVQNNNLNIRYRANYFRNGAALNFSSSYYPTGYPYLVFTAVDPDVDLGDMKNSTPTSDGYKEIVYWLAPKNPYLKENNYSTAINHGEVNNTFMDLIRVENDTYSSSTTNNSTASFFVHNSLDTNNNPDIILSNVLWMSFSLGKNDNTLDRITSYNNVSDGSVYTFENKSYSDPSPDYVDVVLSIMPEVKDIAFTINKDIDVSTPFHAIESINDIGEAQGETLKVKNNSDPIDGIDITFDQAYFQFAKEGHLYYPDENAVVHYNRHRQADGTTDIYLTYPTGGVSIGTIPAGAVLYAAESYYRRIYLK